MDCAKLELIPTSFAWPTFGGQYEPVEPNTLTHLRKDETNKNTIAYRAQTNTWDFQNALFADNAKNIELFCHLTINAIGAGCTFETHEDGKRALYFLSLEPDKRRIMLFSGADFRYVAGREVALDRNRQYAIRVLLIDGQIEVYIDSVLTLQCGIPLYDRTRPGLFCDRGNAVWNDLELYALEL